MSDLIDRQAAIDLFPNDALEWDTKGGYIAPHLARRMIEELPSAQPEQRWIPIKNRLPAVRCCRCLITRDDGSGRATVEEALFSFGRWYSNEWLEDGRNREFDISASVIAWAPFPAPYRGR